MKVLYVTVPSFFDLDISLIRELSNFCDVKVLLIVSPESMHLSAFSIEELRKQCDIIPATNYTEIHKYSNLIDLQKWYIANNPDNSIKSCLKLKNKIDTLIDKEHIDLIHSTTTCKTAAFLLPTIKQFKNSLFTLHDPIPHKKISFLRKCYYRSIYWSYENLLFLSDSLIDSFREKYKSNNRVYYSKLGVYDYLSSFPIHKNSYDKYILFFGKISYYKGVDLLIESYQQSNASSQGIKLVIAGKGDINSDIKNENIILLNHYIENEELASLIQNSLFVVLPYRSSTQSGCVMSAFAFNKPVLATNVGDFSNVITNKETGLLVEPNDITSLRDGIDYMVTSNLALMSNNIEKQYKSNGDRSWKNITWNLFCTYNQILKNSK